VNAVSIPTADQTPTTKPSPPKRIVAAVCAGFWDSISSANRAGSIFQ